MALPDGFDVNNPACPVCGGRLWDNRESKRNPKAPDWKCRDKQCDGAVWLDKGDKRPTGKPASKPTGQPPQTPQPSAQPAYQSQQRHRLTKDEFWALQRDFFVLGVTVVRQSAKDNGLSLTDCEIAGLAQDMQAQALIGLERGVWAVDQPEQAKVEGARAGGVKLGGAAAGFTETLNLCLTEPDADGVRNMFMADANVTVEERQELLRRWIERKREIAKVG